MTLLISLLTILLTASSAWATLPTLPTEFDPGTTPALANTKYVCATVTVTGATNASPIVIATTGHFFVTGQTVVIASVGGNTAANGTWVVTKVDATHFSLNSSTGTGAYTSGGTANCPDGGVNNATALQSAIDALVSTGGTICLNEAEIYIAPVAGAGDAYSNGFIFRTKSSTNYTVLRTCDYGTGNRPAEGQRVERLHQPTQAKIQNGTTNQANAWTAITCEKAANYYWVKDIEFTLASGQLNSAQYSGDMIGCAHQYAAGSAAPPKKVISNITVVGSTVTVTTNVPGGFNRLWTGKDVTVVCNGSCGVTGINANTYTVTQTGNQVVTFTQAGTTGTYSGSGHYLKEATSMFPDHVVFDQVWIEVTNYTDAAQAAPHYKNVGIRLFGTHEAVINSHIDMVGGPACEQGVPITSQTGAQIVRIQNNYLSGSGMTIFTGGSPWINGFGPNHWVIRQNVLTRRMANLQQNGDVSSNYYVNNVCNKNLLETKGMQYVLVEGNQIGNGWPATQATMFHWTNLQDIAVDSTCGTSTPLAGEGCWPETTSSDLTIRNNRFFLLGYNCVDIIAFRSQAGLFYMTTPTARVLVTNNLFVGCPAYASTAFTKGTGITLGAGPADVTITHNTFVRPVSKAYMAWMDVTCYDNDTGTISAGCGNGGLVQLETVASLTNLVVQDNIITSHDQYGVWMIEGGSVVGCTSTLFTTALPTATWNHNIGVGTMPGGCSAINGTTLSTGTQMVADEPSMNFRGYATHDYCLTNTSPGYHAASDGTNVGVDMKALYNAMGLAYTPGACP